MNCLNIFSKLPLITDLPVNVVLNEVVSQRNLELALKCLDDDSKIKECFCPTDQPGFLALGGDILSRKWTYKLNLVEGRYYCRTQFINRKIRDWIFSSSSMLDIKNCHFSLIAGYLLKFCNDAAEKFPLIIQYSADKNVIQARLLNEIGGTFPDNFDPKRFFLALLNGLTLFGVRRDLNLKFQDIPPVVLSFVCEIELFHAYMYNVEGFAENYHEPEKTSFDSVRRFINVLESLHALVLIDEVNDLFPATLWVHDGVELMGQHEGDLISNEFLTCLTHSLASRGFYETVKFEFKDKKDSINYCKSQLPKIGNDLLNEARVNLLEIMPPKASLLNGIEYETDYIAIKKRMEHEFGLFRTLEKDPIYWKFPNSHEWKHQSVNQFSTALAHLKFKECLTKIGTKRKPDGEEVVKEFYFTKRYLEDSSVNMFDKAGYFPEGCSDPFVKNLYSGVEISHVRLSDSDYTNPYYKSSVDFFVSHLLFLCDGDNSCFEWLMAYIAHMFQYPNVIPRVMLVLYSAKQGTGKSLLSVILNEMIGNAAIMTSDLESVLGKFNGVIEGKLLISIDEGKVEKKEHNRILKALVTGERTTVTTKGVDAKSVKNFARIILTTNETQPVKFQEDEEDRRTQIIECKGSQLDSSYAKRLSNLRYSKKVLRLIYERFLNYPVAKDFDFSRARPKTEIFKEMIAACRSAEKEAFIDFMSERITSAIYHKEDVIVSDSRIMYTAYTAYLTKYYPSIVSYNKVKSIKLYIQEISEWLDLKKSNEKNNKREGTGCFREQNHGTTVFKFEIKIFKPWFFCKADLN